MTEEHLKVSIKIPFPSKRHAEIAYDVLRIDDEPKRSFVTKSMTLEENSLSVIFTGELAKHIRVAVTAFFDALLLSCETVEAFGPPTTEKYDFY